MASGDPVKKLCEELACPICLEYFKEPVIISCGHNFCQSCLDHCWEEKGASCPQCREKVQEGDIKRNWQLANLVEIAKELGSQKTEEKGRFCQRHQEPLKLFCKDHEDPICVVCDRSKEHENHKVIPLDEALKEYKDQIWKFLETLKKEREKILAYKADTARESQDLLEKTQREKEKTVAAFKHMHQFLEEQERNLLAKIEETEKEISAKGEEQLARLSEELSSLLKLIQEMEEKHQQPTSELLQLSQQRATAIGDGGPSRHNTMAAPSQHSSRTQAPTRWKRRGIRAARSRRASRPGPEARPEDAALGRPAAGEQRTLQFPVVPANPATQAQKAVIRAAPAVMATATQQALQWRGRLMDIRSTLEGYNNKEEFETSAAFPPALKWKIWDFCDFTPFLEGVMKQFIASLESGLQQEKAHVTLDPDTAHPRLILSEDRRHVTCGEKRQDLLVNPERFNLCPFVLGQEGFTGGRHFWEVLVKNGETWFVGVVRNSVQRKGFIPFGPGSGIWGVGKWLGRAVPPSVTMSEEPKRVRVTLNYEGGRVAFYNADSAALILEYPPASFSGETLLPYFYVYKKGQLELSP